MVAVRRGRLAPVYAKPASVSSAHAESCLRCRFEDTLISMLSCLNRKSLVVYSPTKGTTTFFQNNRCNRIIFRPAVADLPNAVSAGVFGGDWWQLAGAAPPSLLRKRESIATREGKKGIPKSKNPIPGSVSQSDASSNIVHATLKSAPHVLKPAFMELRSGV